jgi:nanoRNase/pAp phosphatase (c-di-AMP/oligoRNAs hydrolase)
MLTSDNIQVFKNHLSSAENILILFPGQVKFDQVASALALFLGFQEINKNVSVLSPKPVTVGFSSLVGIDKVSTQLGNKNLQVSFEYEEEAVDKVSYHIDEENRKFNLVVQPKKGVKPLRPESVSFSYTGVEADLIIVIGAHSLEDMEQIYFAQEELYKETPTISINTYETNFGTVKLSTAGSASFCEVMAYLLQELEIEVSSDMATNLLGGIESATNNFQAYSTSADTFEIAGRLLRLGARRINTMQSTGMSNFMDALGQAQKKEEKPVPPKVTAPDNKPQAEKKNKSKSTANEHIPRMEGGSRV